jgi:hypothetical protein
MMLTDRTRVVDPDGRSFTLGELRDMRQFYRLAAEALDDAGGIR